MTDLSILMCSIHTRYRTYALHMQDMLYRQWHGLSKEDRDRVQIMVLGDNKKMSIGAKRNAMVQAAAGQYVQFVDDDDRVAADSISSVLHAIRQYGTDVITFLASVSIEGGPPKICNYSHRWRYDHDVEDGYRRIPNHICVVRRQLALDTGFQNRNYGEDAEYAKRLLPRIRTEHQIDKVLYYYDYYEAISESRR